MIKFPDIRLKRYYKDLLSLFQKVGDILVTRPLVRCSGLLLLGSSRAFEILSLCLTKD